MPCHPATANSGYGNATALRDTPTGRGPQHEPGNKRDTSVWPPGPEPVPHTAHHALGDNLPDLVLDRATSSSLWWATMNE